MLQWHPPELGSWKLNVDRAIFPNHHRAGVGYILRNDKRNVSIIVTQPEGHTSELMEVELLTIFHGLQFCALMGIPNLIVETYCLLAV